MTEHGNVGLGWTDDEIREVAAEFVKAERQGVPCSYLGERPLPMGLELDPHTGYVRSKLPKEGVLAVEYFGVDGFMKWVWVRPVEWVQIPQQFKNYLWEDEIVTPYGSDPGCLLYQAEIIRAFSIIDWDTARQDYWLNPETAVFHRAPWGHIENYCVNQTIGGDPLLYIKHISFALAEIMRREDKEAEAERKAAAEAERQAKLLEEQERRSAFWEKYEAAKAAVTYRADDFTITAPPATRGGEPGQEVVSGYSIVTRDDQKDTGFGAHKSGRKSWTRWTLTQKGSGLMMPNCTFDTRSEAVGVAGLLYALWDGWPNVKEYEDIPEDLRPKVGELLNTYSGYTAEAKS